MNRFLRGFTLVELLIVIAILTILAAMLLPTLRQAVEASREVVCMSNLKQFGFAMGLYANDSRGWVPHAVNGQNNESDHYNNGPAETPYQKASPIWHYGLSPYVGDSAAVYSCPSVKYQWMNKRYGYGVIWRWNSANNSNRPVWVGANQPLKSNFLNNPGGVIYLIETAATHRLGTCTCCYGGQTEKAVNHCHAGNQPGGPGVWDAYFSMSTDPRSDKTAAPRHRGRVCFLLFDGHVQSMEGRKLLESNYDQPDCLWDLK